MIDIRKPVAAILLAASVGGWLGAAAAQAQTLKVAMGSDVKIVDPIWTTAYIQRDFGYMVWDVLFAIDETLAVRPQMVEHVGGFARQAALDLHPARSRVEQWPAGHLRAIASPRSGAGARRDSMGRKMLASVDGFEAVDARTFRMKMKEPYGLVLESLGKPSSSPAFMMPKKTADTDPNTQIKVEDVIGSGPFTFKADEWKPGEKIVFLRNGGYRPRSEPPSGLAGGKVAKVERVEWIWIPDAQTQVAALGNGEIDIIQAPPHDLLPILSQDRNAKLFDSNPLGSQYEFRFNTLFKPFDDPADPPRRDGGVRPGRVPQGDDRRSEILQGLQGALRLRHAARLRRGHEGRAEPGCRAGQGASQGKRATTARRSCCCRRAKNREAPAAN